MKCLVLLAALAAFPAVAQPPASPEVQPDGRVTFRLRAANATAVQVHCEGVSETNMAKDERGVWSLTTAPLPPDIYAYSFTVDGLHIIDPANPLLKYSEQANKQLRLLWMSCGTEERLIAPNRMLSDWLTAKGVRHTWVETEGAHSFRVWRRNLAEFAPQLFQPKK